MAKFGKAYRKLKIAVWSDRYINYKILKQFIKRHKGLKTQNYLNIEEKVVVALKKDFLSILDKELKRMYLFFIKNERELYVLINSHLHLRKQYSKYDRQKIVSELDKMRELALTTLNLTQFIIDNMVALRKILKKFDKNFMKLLGPIAYEFISSKLATNSDLLYIFRFKIVDEISAILDDLTNDLETSFDSSKPSSTANKIDDSVFSQQVLSSNLLQVSVNDSDDVSLNVVRNSHRPLNMKKSFNASFVVITGALSQIDEKIQTFKNDFKEWSQFLKLTSKEKGNMQVFVEKEAEEEILKRKESLNMNISTVLSFDFFEIITPTNEYIISKENKRNIKLTFVYSLLVSTCFTVILPNNPAVLRSDIYFTSVIIAMTPIGSLISLAYELLWNKRSHKKPLLLSCFFLIAGNLLYVLSFIDSYSVMMIIGRLCIGLGASRNSNRTYLLEYVPKRNIKKTLLKHKILTLFGLCLGPFLILPFSLTGAFFNVSAIVFNDKSLPSAICFILSLLMFVFLFVFYREPIDNPGFSPYTNYLEENVTENIKETEDRGDDKSRALNRNIINKINDQVQEINVKSKFTDTNLVSQSIEMIIQKEKGQVKYLYKAFAVILLLTLLCTFTTEFILVFASIEMNAHLALIISSSAIALVFVVALFAILPFYLLFWYIISIKLQDKNFILGLLFTVPLTCFIAFIPGTVIGEKVESILFIVAFVIVVMVSSLLQDAVHHMFVKIVPGDYVVKRLPADIFLKFASEFGKMAGCLIVLIGSPLEKRDIMKEVAIGIVIGLFLTVGFVTFAMKDQLREKPISRLLRGKAARKFKITEF